MDRRRARDLRSRRSRGALVPSRLCAIAGFGFGSSVEMSVSRRPPLWLAAAAIAAGLAATYATVVWIASFRAGPIHVDVRMYYVAAEAGVRYGWATTYDQSVLRALSSGFPPTARFIDDQTTYASLPLLAWVFAPLT